MAKMNEAKPRLTRARGSPLLDACGENSWEFRLAFQGKPVLSETIDGVILRFMWLNFLSL
jgi:hypothetical protein